MFRRKLHGLWSGLMTLPNQIWLTRPMCSATPPLPIHICIPAVATRNQSIYSCADAFGSEVAAVERIQLSSIINTSLLGTNKEEPSESWKRSRSTELWLSLRITCDEFVGCLCGWNRVRRGLGSSLRRFVAVGGRGNGENYKTTSLTSHNRARKISSDACYEETSNPKVRYADKAIAVPESREKSTISGGLFDSALHGSRFCGWHFAWIRTLIVWYINIYRCLWDPRTTFR